MKECVGCRLVCCLRKSVLLAVFSLFSMLAYGEGASYRCELGVLGGLAYYTGDANPHIFQHVSASYGGYFRYKFTPRWALRAKAQYASLGYKWEDELCKSRLGQLDVIGEYNFFRFSFLS